MRSVSAFGGVVAANREVDALMALALAQILLRLLLHQVFL